jgi:hypothetical protein
LQREKTREQLPRFWIAALQHVIVNEPKAARQKSPFAGRKAVSGIIGFVAQNEFAVD